MSPWFFLVLLLMAQAAPVFAQQPELPPGYPPGLYDESKVPAYTLPDPLVTLDGQPVTDAETWQRVRRPEILRLFEAHVYGRTMAGRPDAMTWAIAEADPPGLEGDALQKTITLYFTGQPDGPRMDLHLLLPVEADQPVPIFLMPGRMPNPELLIERGYGVATFNPGQIEPDRRDSSYATGLRKVFAPEGQTEPAPDEWGAIGAWAWAMSRAMDYLETDPAVDARRVAIMGFSRYGKVAMWAGAQDERFALVISGQSGCGGAVIVRRGFGETVASLNGYAPHWFSGTFKTYNDRVHDLPVDWHLLVAAMAPRPVYIATAEEDYWGDPRGSFLSGKHAAPVYALFGKTGLGVDEMPPIETPVGDVIGYHNRKGGHGVNAYDWAQFLAFTDRHFNMEHQK